MVFPGTQSPLFSDPTDRAFPQSLPLPLPAVPWVTKTSVACAEEAPPSTPIVIPSNIAVSGTRDHQADNPLMLNTLYDSFTGSPLAQSTECHFLALKQTNKGISWPSTGLPASNRTGEPYCTYLRRSGSRANMLLFQRYPCRRSTDRVGFYLGTAFFQTLSTVAPPYLNSECSNAVVWRPADSSSSVLERCIRETLWCRNLLNHCGQCIQS
jgi:hypothetical protein